MKFFLFFALLFGHVAAANESDTDLIKRWEKCQECANKKQTAGSCSNSLGGPCYRGLGGSLHDELGGPLYHGLGGNVSWELGGRCYDGLGGNCYAGLGGNCADNDSARCPNICSTICELHKKKKN